LNEARRAALCLQPIALRWVKKTLSPATGDFSDAKVIRKFSDVPDDLNGL
jgi:hypothetical protein